MQKILSLSFAILIVLFSCTSPNNPSNEDPLSDKKDSNSEDFEKFYSKFHKDTSFQMSRLKYPIKGYRDDHGVVTNWTKDNWGYFKTPLSEIDTTEFKVSSVRTDSLVTEKVWIPNSGFWLEVNYQLINNKWFLVYYLDHNY